jgi:iron transport multicopper oxidase
MVYKLKTLVPVLIILSVLLMIQINSAKLRKASITLKSDESEQDSLIKEMLNNMDKEDEMNEAKLNLRDMSDDKKESDANKKTHNKKKDEKENNKNYRLKRKHNKKEKKAKHNEVIEKNETNEEIQFKNNIQEKYQKQFVEKRDNKHQKQFVEKKDKKHQKQFVEKKDKKHKRHYRDNKKEMKQIQFRENKVDKDDYHHQDDEQKQIHSYKQNGHTYKAKYNIGYFESCPDGFCRQVLGINGHFPPTIRVKKGDDFDITIKNNLPNRYVDLHWHGLFQKGTVTSDGVGQVNQCSPLFGQKYRYKFSSGNQSGTFWYHGHSGLDYVDGLRGPLIIDDPEDPYLRPFNYILDKKYSKISGEASKVCKDLFYVDHSKVDKNHEVDSVILLSDWHHTIAEELGNFFLSPLSGGAEPTPDSALINNKGNYYCKPPKCESMYNTKIINGKAKKFRIINASAMAVFHFAIEGHSIYLVESDGVPLDGTTKVNILRLNVGQRVSVIVKANQDPGNYWIRAQMDPNIYPNPPSAEWQPEVFGVLEYAYADGDKFHNSLPKEENYRAMDALFDESMQQAMIYIDMNVPMIPLRQFTNYPPMKADRTFILNVTHNVGKNNVHLMGFNNILFTEKRDTTLLGLVIDDKDLNQNYIDESTGLTFGYNPLVYKKGEVIDIIFNNFDDGEHPMHIHGHNFYVMYAGPANSKDFITDIKSVYTFEHNKNAPVRDVATVNRNSVLVIRFVADNPGTWAVHCHIEWHLIAGLMASLVEDEHYTRKLYNKYRSKVTYCHTYKEQRYNSMILMANQHFRETTASIDEAPHVHGIDMTTGNENNSVETRSENITAHTNHSTHDETVVVMAPPVVNGVSLDETNTNTLVIPPTTITIDTPTTTPTELTVGTQIPTTLLSTVLKPILENLATTVTTAVREGMNKDTNIHNAHATDNSADDIISTPSTSNTKNEENTSVNTTTSTVTAPAATHSHIHEANTNNTNERSTLSDEAVRANLSNAGTAVATEDNSSGREHTAHSNIEVNEERNAHTASAHDTPRTNDRSTVASVEPEIRERSPTTTPNTSNEPAASIQSEVRSERNDDRPQLRTERSDDTEKPQVRALETEIQQKKADKTGRPQEREVETVRTQDRNEKTVEVEKTQERAERSVENEIPQQKAETTQKSVDSERPQEKRVETEKPLEKSKSH